MPRICVIGGGRWGKNHVRTLEELGFLGGIVDTDSERLHSLSGQYPNAAVLSSVEDALREDFDGFVVATPAHTHFDVARKVLESRKPVLVEKPLALSADKARELRDIARSCEQTLMVGHLLLFHPAIIKIKQVIDSGKLGKLQYIYSTRINLGTVRTEENILWSFAPHDISIFQYFLSSRPLEVVSRGGAYLQPGIHDTTMTILRYPGNVMCHNFVSWLHPFKEHRLVLIGSKGMLSFQDSDSKELLFYEKGIDFVQGNPIKRDGATEVIPYEDLAPLAEELKYFASHLNGGVERADPESAIEVLEILESATDDLSSGLDLSLTSSAQVAEVTLSSTVSPAASIEADAFVHESSYVDAGCHIGAGTKIWHFSHVQKGASIGSSCSLGQNVNVGNNVRIGNGVRIQNNVSVYEGVTIEDDVFCGPSMTFTNVSMPRARFPTGSEAYGETLIRRGASIGANATIVCGHTLGKHSFIAAGAVVTKDVPDFAFMRGVPAQQDGWMTEGGERIPSDFVGRWKCARSGIEYRVSEQSILPMEAAATA